MIYIYIYIFVYIYMCVCAHSIYIYIYNMCVYVEGHWRKNTFDYWKQNKVHPYSPHWKKKLKNLYFELFCSWKPLFDLICTICTGFWNLIMQFAWYLKRFGLESLVCTVLAASWSQHLYYAGDYLQHFVLSAAFRIICSILSRVSFWIYFRLVRVYLGDQRMRRVKDQVKDRPEYETLF